MKSPHNVWRYAALLGVLVAALAAFACEPGRIPEYENATSQRVTIYKDGIAAFSLEPHESTKIAMFEEDWLPNIKVVADDGRVLLEDHITWDEVREMGYKIVITDPEHPPSPSPTPSPGTTPTA
jgi:hypothetical protein